MDIRNAIATAVFLLMIILMVVLITRCDTVPNTEGRERVEIVDPHLTKRPAS